MNEPVIQMPPGPPAAAGGRVLAGPGPGPAARQQGAGPVPRRGAGRLPAGPAPAGTTRAAELCARLAAAADGDEVRALAGRLAVLLAPEARRALLSALAEAGDAHDRRTGPGAGHGPAGRPGGRDRAAVLSPAAPGAARKAPPGLVRIRFADARALERAAAAFDARPGTDLRVVPGDGGALTLHLAADTGLGTVRAVLAVLDAEAVTAESLTVHSQALDDVFAAVTCLP